MTTLPASSSSWIFLGVMFWILALVCTPSVTMPAWAPVSETAGDAEGVQGHGRQRDGCLLAGGQQHVHLALAGQRHDLLGQLDQAVGDAAHGGDHHDHLVALGAVLATRAATFLMRSVLPTEVPPYF